MFKRLTGMLVLYVRWVRAGQTWWARWHFYVGLMSVYVLLSFV